MKVERQTKVREGWEKAEHIKELALCLTGAGAGAKGLKKRNCMEGG